MVWLYREESWKNYLLTGDCVTLGDDVIQRAQRGDTSAWRALIVAHQRDVFTLLALLLERAELAELEHLAQATLSSILRDLAGLAPLASPRLSTWIYITAARRAVATLQKSDSSIAEVTEVANATNIHVTAILRSFAGFTDSEIARVLGIAIDEIPQDVPNVAVHGLEFDVPMDFAERVVAARRDELAAAQAASDAAPADVDGTRAQQKFVGRTAAVVTVSCIVALILGLARTPSLGTNLQGAAAPTARQTLSIGSRAIVVAEAGAALHWRIEAAGTRVTQDAGDVFYRVERIGQFSIHTPVGDVRADGACIRVAVGAASAIITVAQGRATISPSGNDIGRATTAIVAGQRATMRASVTPIISDFTDAALR